MRNSASLPFVAFVALAGTEGVAVVAAAVDEAVDDCYWKRPNRMTLTKMQWFELAEDKGLPQPSWLPGHFCVAGEVVKAADTCLAPAKRQWNLWRQRPRQLILQTTQRGTSLCFRFPTTCSSCWSLPTEDL